MFQIKRDSKCLWLITKLQCGQVQKMTRCLFLQHIGLIFSSVYHWAPPKWNVCCSLQLRKYSLSIEVHHKSPALYWTMWAFRQMFGLCNITCLQFRPTQTICSRLTHKHNHYKKGPDMRKRWIHWIYSTLAAYMSNFSTVYDTSTMHGYLSELISSVTTTQMLPLVPTHPRKCSVSPGKHVPFLSTLQLHLSQIL